MSTMGIRVLLLCAAAVLVASNMKVPMNLTTVDLVSLNGLFDFLFGAVGASRDIQGLFDPLVINSTIHISKVLLTLYHIEIVGASHLRRITPCSLFYDGKNLTISGTIAIERLQLSLDYKLAANKRDTLCGHMDRAEILFALTIPFTGGGSPYCKSLQLSKIVGFKVSSGNNILAYITDTRLGPLEIMAAVAEVGQGIVNKYLKNITLPSVNKTHDEL